MFPTGVAATTALGSSKHQLQMNVFSIRWCMREQVLVGTVTTTAAATAITLTGVEGITGDTHSQILVWGT